MKTLLAALIAVISLAWASEALNTVSPAGTHPLWLARQEGLYLSGLLSIGLMSLTMLLATRPAWLETPLGGMDRVYRTHKWAGILAVVFAAVHWLIEMSDDILKGMIGREGRLPKEKFAGLLDVMRDLAEDMGEWAIYAVLAMLAITLWKKFPYRPWRFLHRAMPVLYLMLVFHAALLAPQAYWLRPTGWLLGALLLAGSYGALRSLFGTIGQARQARGEIIAVEQPVSGITSVRCQLGDGWRGHRPGQFALVTFEAGEGAHPFTIASADRGDGSITFQIKALGDYTGRLATALRVGQPVRVEGPYGRFALDRLNRQAQQIWIAGGIGVTPFLAWLEAMQGGVPDAVSADLHYCIRQRANDPFVERLEALCAGLPGVRLHVHAADQGQRLDATGLMQGKDPAQRSEVWFCGPAGLADGLKAALHRLWSGRLAFHQEAFVMR
ncbi:ferric reductase-like transmembrane domain-containing protein [Azonexus sp. IMCC34842]|uniref:ferredoxin reductase family protein n=1 Tax=Azonexus sp. IMCC34842 TaxID=3420950 RepID=UPI003D12D74B